MPEPHLSVPVSLLRDLLDDYGHARVRAKRDATARLEAYERSREAVPSCGEPYVGYKDGEGSCTRPRGHAGSHWSLVWGLWDI